MQTRYKPKELLTAILALLILNIGASWPTLAQEPSASGQLEEVVVTARKRAESLQDIPISVSAYSQKTLEEIGLESLTSISASTPNLQLQRGAGGDSTLTACMRGMCRTDDISTEDPMVGIYVDGFYAPKAVGAFFDLVDIQQIEVLRGPQGTLFGKNTVGGAINVTTVKPGEEFEASFFASLGNYDYASVRGMLNLPLSDSVAARLSVSDTTRDGMVKSRNHADLNDKDYQALRLALRWDASDNLTFGYTYDHYDSDQHSNPWQLTAAGPGLELFFPNMTAFADEDFQDLVSTVRENNDEVKQEFHGLVAEWEVGSVGAIDGLTIKSLTGYRETGLDSYRNSLPFYFISGPRAVDTDFLSQELQFVGELFDGSLQFVTGLYFSSEDGTHYLEQEFGSATPNAILDMELETDTRAIFGEVNFDINESWSASVGIRYTEEERKVDSNILNADGTLRTAVSQLAADDEFDTDNVSPRLSLRYLIDDSTMVYGTYSVGFKSGGLNGRASNPSDFSVYDDAEATNYEIGLKADLFDNQFRLNVAYFYTELDDWQVQVNSIDPTTFQFLTTIENASSATIEGLEAEATWFVTPKFRLNATYGYIDTKYDEYKGLDFTTGLPIDVANNREFQFAPETSYSLNARYETQTELGNLVARVDYAFVDDQYFQTLPSSLIEGDDYTLLDARLELNNISGSNFSIALWGENLGDEEYRTGGFDVPTFGIAPPDGMFANSWGNLRTYGIDLRYDWN